jgi:hypothetical protein
MQTELLLPYLGQQLVFPDLVFPAKSGNVSDEEKVSFLLELFSQSNLPGHIAMARQIYEDHLTAKAALQLAIRNADHHQERWKQCREGIVLMKLQK